MVSCSRERGFLVLAPMSVSSLLRDSTKSVPIEIFLILCLFLENDYVTRRIKNADSVRGIAVVDSEKHVASIGNTTYTAVSCPGDRICRVNKHILLKGNTLFRRKPTLIVLMFQGFVLTT